jgi:galactonate dehydratase
MGAFSGLEMACWDIVGKARNRPVHAMLGGKINERLRSYTYLYPEPGKESGEFWVSPDMAGEAAARFVNMGFTAVKFDPAGPYTIRGGHDPSGSDITRSAAFCKAIRDAIGDRADLLFGTHGQFNVAGAVRLAQAIEPYGPLWYEEPIPPDNLLDFAEVQKSVRIPVATGERFTTKAEFATVCARAARASCNPPSVGPAAYGSARRSLLSPRSLPPRWHPTSMLARSSGQPTSSLAPRSRTF